MSRLTEYTRPRFCLLDLPIDEQHCRPALGKDTRDNLTNLSFSTYSCQQD
jgi:hypothetical protein